MIGDWVPESFKNKEDYDEKRNLKYATSTKKVSRKKYENETNLVTDHL